MKIKLLEDNTVIASYDDGTSENINSGNYLSLEVQSIALSPQTEALVIAFPNKNKEYNPYNTEDDSDITLSFNSKSCKVGDIDPLELLLTDERTKKFCEIVFTDEVVAAFIEQLPQIPVTTEQQRVVQVPAPLFNEDGSEVPENPKNAYEHTISMPEGEERILLVDGVATSKKIYEKKIWIAPLFNEDGSEAMQSVQVVANGEPVFERYHKKTDARYPI